MRRVDDFGDKEIKQKSSLAYIGQKKNIIDFIVRLEENCDKIIKYVDENPQSEKADFILIKYVDLLEDYLNKLDGVLRK